MQYQLPRSPVLIHVHILPFSSPKDLSSSFNPITHYTVLPYHLFRSEIIENVVNTGFLSGLGIALYTLFSCNLFLKIFCFDYNFSAVIYFSLSQVTFAEHTSELQCGCLSHIFYHHLRLKEFLLHTTRRMMDLKNDA